MSIHPIDETESSGPGGPEIEDEGAPGSLRRALARFALLVVLLTAGFVAVRWTPLGELWQPERLMAQLDELRHHWWAPLALIGLYVLLCPLGLPASPLMLVGGFVFGAFAGAGLNFLGTFLAAAVSYSLGRLLGRDLVVHLAGDRLQRVETLLNRRGFWNLARVRFLPVPFPLINYGAALAGVRSSVFLGASAVGLAPAVFIYTWFAAALARATGEERGGVLVQMVLAVIAVITLTFLPAYLRGRSRRRRYRRILEEREERGRRPTASPPSDPAESHPAESDPADESHGRGSRSSP